MRIQENYAGGEFMSTFQVELEMWEYLDGFSGVLSGLGNTGMDGTMPNVFRLAPQS